MIYIFGMQFTYLTEERCRARGKLEIMQFRKKTGKKVLSVMCQLHLFSPKTVNLNWLPKWHLLDLFADLVVSPWSRLRARQTCIAVVSSDYVIQFISCFQPLEIRWAYFTLSKPASHMKFKVCAGRGGHHSFRACLHRLLSEDLLLHWHQASSSIFAHGFEWVILWRFKRTMVACRNPPPQHRIQYTNPAGKGRHGDAHEHSGIYVINSSP